METNKKKPIVLLMSFALSFIICGFSITTYSVIQHSKSVSDLIQQEVTNQLKKRYRAVPRFYANKITVYTGDGEVVVVTKETKENEKHPNSD